jgi:hypothetical protein
MICQDTSPAAMRLTKAARQHVNAEVDLKRAARLLLIGGGKAWGWYTGKACKCCCQCLSWASGALILAGPGGCGGVRRGIPFAAFQVR